MDLTFSVDEEVFGQVSEAKTSLFAIDFFQFVSKVTINHHQLYLEKGGGISPESVFLISADRARVENKWKEHRSYRKEQERIH